MSLLLDTHALLWWLGGAGLSEMARAAITEPANLVYVSSASIWEISIKRAIGKLQAADPLELDPFEPLPITWAHAAAAGSLPRHHQDPFDRMLVAQAQVENLTLVTRDRRLAAYDVAILVC